MLFWWMSADIDFDTWLQGSAVIVGLGALLTFIRFCHRYRQAAQADAPVAEAPMWLPSINIEVSPEPPVVEHTPRRRRRPTIIDQ
jgi:hypothetical protein